MTSSVSTVSTKTQDQGIHISLSLKTEKSVSVVLKLFNDYKTCFRRLNSNIVSENTLFKVTVPKNTKSIEVYADFDFVDCWSAPFNERYGIAVDVHGQASFDAFTENTYGKSHILSYKV